MSKTYKVWKREWREYMKTQHWTDLKQAKFLEAGRTCTGCGSSKRIEVHHVNYRKFTDCTVADLMVLCGDCHELLHLGLRDNKLQIKEVSESNCRSFLDSVRHLTPQPKPKGPRPPSARRVKKALRKRVNLILRNGMSKREGLERVKDIISRLQEIVNECENQESHIVKLMFTDSSDAVLENCHSNNPF